MILNVLFRDRRRYLANQLRSYEVKDNKSINLNTRDIKDSATESRIIKTILRRVPSTGSKFAVLELSTKAVKLLIGKDVEAIKENIDNLGNNVQGVKFDFGNFLRMADKVDTGKGLDAQNVMSMRFFTNKVLRSILHKKMLMLEQGVDTVYTVATAAYRTATNREEILDLIRDRARINVRILSKNEEATATLFAYAFTSTSRLQLLQSQVIMIDQGGGSTEVSVFKNNQLVGNPFSINLGTTALHNYLFKESTALTPLEHALKNSDKKIKERLVTFYKNMDENMTISGRVFCVCVGTAITRAASGNNAKQHDKVLTRKNIEEQIAKTESLLLERVKTVGELDAVLKSLGPNDRFDTALTIRLGLPMFLALMEKYNIHEIHISGTGLWYGIYIQRLLGSLGEDED